MIACYDLARCPPTYDEVAFLALVEQERLRRGEEYLDIHILPGPVEGFRADWLWPHTVEGRVQMRDRVLIPLCKLLPSVRSVKVEMCRDEWGAGEYYIGLSRIVEALRAGMRPLRGEYLPRSKKLITFTLREADHYPLRNSHVAEWIAAADVLMKIGFHVNIVRDTNKAFISIPGQWITPSSSESVKDRAALYGHAALNVGICNGPMWMSIFMDAPTLMLRPTTNEASGCYDDAFYAQFGLPRGSQLPNSPTYQRLVWEDDTRENIVQAVERMLAHA